MSHGHPRTTALHEGRRGGHEPSSATPPDLLMAASLLPARNWVCRQVVSCQPDLPLAAKAARDFSGRTLRGWGLPVLADDAAVIVSELVSNALRHGAGGRNGAAYDCIELILWRRPGQIICAVTDPGTGTPVLAQPDPLAEAGRGLHVVQALCATWGWTRLGGGRKAVWAALPVPGAEGAQSSVDADPARAGHSRAEWDCHSRSA
jgi:anti-sigma regulatory factor (Ser/Thr protein kinase)